MIGEANFKVNPDKKHPFIVKANDYQVTALGTEFNVNAYPENSELMATLLEGLSLIHIFACSKRLLIGGYALSIACEIH